MCGLISAFNFKVKSKKTKNPTNEENVNKWVINQLEDQISRGKEGFGILFIDEKNNVKIERATELTKTMVDLYMNKSKMIVLHHRTPTSSENKINQTHPILVDNGSLKHKYYVIHNGHINNAEELKKEHEKLGFVYSTSTEPKWTNEIGFNDSESIAIELSRYIEKQTDEIDISGSFAFTIVKVNKKTNKATGIFYGRDNTNPLKMSGSRGKIRLSSEGEGIPTKENTIYNFDLKTFKIKKNRIKIKESEPFSKYDYNENYREYDYKTPETETETETETKTDETEIIEKLEKITESATEELGVFTAEFFEKLNDPNTLFDPDINDKEIQELARKTIVIAMECHKICQNTYTEEMIDNVKEKTDKKLI